MSKLDVSRHQVLLEAGMRARFFRRVHKAMWFHKTTKEMLEPEPHTTTEAFHAEHANMTANGWERRYVWVLVEVTVD